MELSLLVIEDEPEFADYLRRGLTYEGYRVRVASSAEAGLEQLRHSQPDVVFLDVMLPSLSQVARLIGRLQRIDRRICGPRGIHHIIGVSDGPYRQPTARDHRQ